MSADIREPETPAARDVPAVRCCHCLDDGMVCEEHPSFPAHINVEGHRGAECGAGMPCPACCSPIPEDGTHSIAEAFTPDWMRTDSESAVALEPGTLPEHPLRAQDCPALLFKEIG